MAGAMDSLGGHRAQLLAAVARELEGAQKRQAERDRGQVSMFDAEGGGEVLDTGALDLPEMEPWSLHDMLAREKEALGFYVSGHPLERYRDEVSSFASARLADLEEIDDNTTVSVAGIITDVIRKTDRRGNPIAFVGVEDFTGSGEVLTFSDAYDAHAELLQEDAMVLVRGRLSKREGEAPKVVADEDIPLEQVRGRLTRAIHLLLVGEEGPELAGEARVVLGRYPGEVPVYIHLDYGESSTLRLRSGSIRVDPNGPVLNELKDILGDENVWITA